MNIPLRIAPYSSARDVPAKTVAAGNRSCADGCHLAPVEKRNVERYQYMRMYAYDGGVASAFKSQWKELDARVIAKCN
jgi:hypothetical protein